MIHTRILGTCVLLSLGLALFPLGGVSVFAQGSGESKDRFAATPSVSELQDLLTLYSADEASLTRYWRDTWTDDRRERLSNFYREWQDKLSQVRFQTLGRAGRVDYILFANLLQLEIHRLEDESKRASEVASLLPFRDDVMHMAEARLQMQTAVPRDVAAVLTRLNEDLKRLQKDLEEKVAESTKKKEEELIGVKNAWVHRALSMAGQTRTAAKEWFGYYNGYDPLFTWWVAEPYTTFDKTLQDYEKFLREKVLGIKEKDDPKIFGDPVGREILVREMRAEMIPYTPEEILDIAQREFAWCDAEMLKATRDLGYGDDWKSALEHVKNQHVDPGRQPQLIRDLALEAIDFVETRGLVTVPALAVETWRMQMMSPEQQRVSPFFLGGEVIRVSYPTHTMTHEEKLMSMRGNNRHFSRATVHHELIPGHHLQGFMTSRYNAHRRPFNTPFWGEGWALYWEMLLWELNFPQSAEDRVGMLFWRMHRCARIIFSLGYHLEQMTAEECVDFLVDRVGHEKANAEAEVRRSFNGSYPPLYQAAYMLGGLQFRALHRQLVGSARMTDREFHDAVLKENRIPVEMVRALLTDQELTAGFTTQWRFYDPVP